MTQHRVGTREEWLAARSALLEREKELTRRNDDLARERRELPWVRVEKEYRFESEDGPKTLAELFDGRSQLLVYNFMFGPDYTAGCPVCSSGADTYSGAVTHLRARDVTFLCISRAPLEKLKAYKRRMGLEVSLGLVGGKRLQLRLRSLTHQRGAEAETGRQPRPGSRTRSRVRHRSGRIPGGGPGLQLVRARRRGRLPHVLDLRARPRIHARVLRVPRPGAIRTERGRAAGDVDPPPR
jgi:hypothetical protein